MCSNATAKRGTFVANVLENKQLCDEHSLLRLGLESFPPTRPGQFIQIQTRPIRDQVSAIEVGWDEGWPRLRQPELTDKEPMLRRPLSLGGRRDTADGVELEIIYRAVGTGTSWLKRVARRGMKLSILGPLGNGFTLGDEPCAVLVGGGVGIPPMIYMARELRAAGKNVVAFCGARTGRLLPVCPVEGAEISAEGRPTLCLSEFAEVGVPAVVATDDGTMGLAGVVTEAFRDWLNVHVPAEGELAVYSCGPEPMMRALADICLSRGYRCELALERHMACGMGTCQSCVVKIRQDNERGWAFKLCCTDGPVFDARQILW